MRTGTVIRRVIAPAIAVLVILALPGPAWAVPGDPDTSFSDDGFQTGDFPGGSTDDGESVIVQSNRRIVVGGSSGPGSASDFALFRMRPNGTPDTDFSGDGFRTLDFRGGGGDDEIFDLVQQDDGKIVAVGFSDTADGSRGGFAVARFRANGSLDPSFSGDGRLLVNFRGLDLAVAYAVALQEDGRILVGGEAGDDDSDDWDMALARITAGGAIDQTYGGGDGQLLTDFSGFDDGIEDLVVQPDGKLVAAGWAQDADGSGFRYGFARYRTNGRLDRTFSGDGKLPVNFPGSGNDAPFGLDVRADGRIVAAGDVLANRVGLVRLQSDGDGDPTFSGDGVRVADVPGGIMVRGFDLAAGNKLVVAGIVSSGFMVARFRPNGTLDTTFGGGDGFIEAFVPNATGHNVRGSAIQPNGRILVVGSALMTTQDFAVGRFLP